MCLVSSSCGGTGTVDCGGSRFRKEYEKFPKSRTRPADEMKSAPSMILVGAEVNTMKVFVNFLLWGNNLNVVVPSG